MCKLKLFLCFSLIVGGGSALATTIPAQSPLFLATAAQPNLLVVLDNSNSMDEAPDGSAVGSNNHASKSWIARSAISSMVNSYAGKINMGLMSYQQPSLVLAGDASTVRNLYNLGLDISHNPANYNPSFTGARSSSTKSKAMTFQAYNYNFRTQVYTPTAMRTAYTNVEMPFYQLGYWGRSGFAYSLTANASNNFTTAGTAPDMYRWFEDYSGTADTLPASCTGGVICPYTSTTTLGKTTPTITASETSLGYSTYLLNNVMSPNLSEDSANSQGITDFGSELAYNWAWYAYYSAGAPGLGNLNIPIAPLNTAQSTSINAALVCNVPLSFTSNANGDTCSTSGIINAGDTPIEGTLTTANNYFNGSLSDTKQGYVASGTNQTYPLPNSCGKNFVAFLTDGLPNVTQAGVINNVPSSILPGSVVAATALNASGVDTYVVGFSLPYGADPNTLNSIAAAGGTSSAFFATDLTTISTALTNVFNDVIEKSSSAASVASNSTQLNTATQIYQAKFNPSDWSGALLSFSINTSTGALITGWDASSRLPAFGSRNIYTFNPSLAAGAHATPFLWTNLTSAQQTYLNTNISSVNDGNGALRVNWLRGDSANEQKNSGGIFRSRTDNLGDIVNSAPAYVGIVDNGFGTLPGAEGSSYSAFTASLLTRRPMIYVGANDGMLHGFDANANASSSSGGTEIFAYIPSALFNNLSALTSPAYSHLYYVDGSSGVSDVYYNSSWHTMLAGSTGAGGRAIFALDITNPDAFGASSALWEFTNTNDVDLGYTLAQPSVVRMQDGQWAVVVANGYASDNGHAVLFFLDPQTGVVLKKIDTGIGSTTTPNGLSTPLVLDTNNDRSIDTIYAGDLYGNLWKFDVSGSATSWQVKGGAPLFVACSVAGAGSSCSQANRQPITSKPTVGSPGGATSGQNNTGYMIYFGTGSYYNSTDNVVGSSPQTESFYGLWDTGSTITDRAKLQAQTITFDGIATTASGAATATAIRTVSKNNVCYSATSPGCSISNSLMSGWYLDLVVSSSTAVGERVISQGVINNGLAIFSTMTPNSDQCSYGGQSRLMEVDAINGGVSGSPVFDTNKDGSVNANDTVTVGGVSQVASGIDMGVGITSSPTIIKGTGIDYKYASGSTGNIGTVTDAGLLSGSVGTRRSWVRLK